MNQMFRDDWAPVNLWPEMGKIEHHWGNEHAGLNYHNLSSNVQLLMPSYGRAQVLKRVQMEQDLHTLDLLHSLFSFRYQPNFEEWAGSAARKFLASTGSKADAKLIEAALRQYSDDTWSGNRLFWSMEDEFDCQFWTRQVLTCKV